jgi:hypothetical protein
MKSEISLFTTGKEPKLLTWQLKTATADYPFVIAAKAATQSYRGFSWIPALRFAAAGMTK